MVLLNRIYSKAGSRHCRHFQVFLDFLDFLLFYLIPYFILFYLIYPSFLSFYIRLFHGLEIHCSYTRNWLARDINCWRETFDKPRLGSTCFKAQEARQNPARTVQRHHKLNSIQSLPTSKLLSTYTQPVTYTIPWLARSSYILCRHYAKEFV